MVKSNPDKDYSLVLFELINQSYKDPESSLDGTLSLLEEYCQTYPESRLGIPLPKTNLVRGCIDNCQEIFDRIGKFVEIGPYRMILMKIAGKYDLLLETSSNEERLDGSHDTPLVYDLRDDYVPPSIYSNQENVGQRLERFNEIGEKLSLACSFLAFPKGRNGFESVMDQYFPRTNGSEETALERARYFISEFDSFKDRVDPDLNLPKFTETCRRYDSVVDILNHRGIGAEGSFEGESDSYVEGFA